MSAREWKPGDVAMVDSWRGKGQIAFRTRRAFVETWCVLDGHDTRGLDDHEGRDGMNGPEHYREAERLLVIAAGSSPSTPTRGILVAAQVHATLALAAASVADRGLGPQEMSGWHSLHAADEWREVTA